MIPLELALGFGIGLSLGLLGGGGSLLTIPALVYLIGQTPQAAMTTSLAIVGANSLDGALMHRAQGTMNWRVGLLFGGAGMLASLVMLVGLPIPVAVGTSLVVIAMNSLAGFLGHMGRGSFDLILTLIFTSAGLAGTFAGTRLSSRISSSKLQKAFAEFVVAVPFFLLYDNLPKFF